MSIGNVKLWVHHRKQKSLKWYILEKTEGIIYSNFLSPLTWADKPQNIIKS